MDYLIEFDYDAEETDELTIRKGDIINSVKVHEDGWMFGILRGKEGVFPSNFGKPLKDERRKSQEDNLIPPQANENKTNNTRESDGMAEQTQAPKKVTGVGFGNIFSQGEIRLKTTNKDNKTKIINEEVKPEILHDKKPPAKTKEMVKAIHSYTAENPDELTLEVGDIITIINKDDEDEGWWRGQKANSQIGVFPENYVELMKIVVEENNKPSRSNVAASQKPGPAPPVTAAKPKINIKGIPPRPPQIPVIGSRSSPKPLEKDDGISFETPVNHKPLVGPTAGRAKQPGKKLPSNIKGLTTNTEKSIDNEVTISKSNSKENLFNIDTTQTTKPKQKESPTIVDRNSESFSKFKSRDSTSMEKTLELSIGKEKPKDITPSPVSNQKENELSHLSKPVNNFKANTLPKNIDADKYNNANCTSSKHETDPKNLNSRISDLEEENADLQKEIIDLRKISNEQINNLKTKLKKLADDLDEEKTKRITNELNFKRLKEKVEDLETSLLSLIDK